MTPILTDAARDLISVVEAMRRQLLELDLDEASTFTRVAARARIETLSDVLIVLAQTLPDIETETVALVLLGTTISQARERLDFLAAGRSMETEAA